jgi:hypothetical protein
LTERKYYFLRPAAKDQDDDIKAFNQQLDGKFLESYLFKTMNSEVKNDILLLKSVNSYQFYNNARLKT